MCGLDIPEQVEGQDFSGIFSDGNIEEREEIYAVYADKVRTIKNKKYKLIEYRFQDVAVTQLYDLEKDPLEQYNMAECPEYQEIRKKLAENLITYGERSGEMEHTAGKYFWNRYFKVSSSLNRL